MTQQRGNITHAFDGFALSVTEFKTRWILVHDAVEWLAVKLDLCCSPRWAWTQRFELGQTVGFWLMNCMHPFERRAFIREWSYPVTDDWAAEHFPDFVEQISTDRPHDVNHGDRCPKCKVGKLNRWNTQWMEKHGECLHCHIRWGTYDTIGPGPQPEPEVIEAAQQSLMEWITEQARHDPTAKRILDEINDGRSGAANPEFL